MTIVSPKITIVGAGRVATHLAKRLKTKGLQVSQVVNRSAEHAAGLAKILGTQWTDQWHEINPETDWLILAVRDDAVQEVASNIAPYLKNALVTHTSGATPGHILSASFDRFGVFYPLQSFSAERQPGWSKIPFCVDANSAEDVLFLKKMAKVIGNLVYQVNDSQRAVLHVAAVFANNFANHCFSVAEKILDEADLPFEMLQPLMEETIAKAIQDSPARMQTGPAVRGDRETLESHIRLLANHPAWQQMYQLISEDIRNNISTS
jgi:predicted short-subunit dehydrogenase-like oxidoreductase (DUF2520 family)